MLDGPLRGALSALSPAGAKARLSIVIFHRVLPLPDALFPEEMDRERFGAVCAWLSSWFNVLPLDEAVTRLQRGALPERALAITFDDGYADNHDIALPVLKAHGLCATFFVATGFLDGGRMWNDTVIQSIRGCTQPTLALGGLGLPGIGVLSLGTAASQRSAIDALLGAIKYLPPAQRSAAVQGLAESAGVALPSTLMMTSTQVRALADAGMQIGAHTVSHPILARIDEPAAVQELRRSKATLEDLLGQPVRSFAYPNGRPGRDYLPRDVVLARQAGFELAVSTAHGAAGAGADVFQLPRFTPWDRPRWAFGARMAKNLWQARAAG
jgi:peptidoglycan/xylan/chitin deacetylase (PgdA/CDA1 family)